MGAREAAMGSAEGLGMRMAIGQEMELQDIPPAVQCRTEQTVEADALLKEVDTVIAAISLYKQQLEEVWALLNQQQNNIPLKFLKEGEETFEGWKKELYDIVSLQRLDETGRAQVEADLHQCARLLQDVRRMFAELRAAAERSCSSGEQAPAAEPILVSPVQEQGGDAGLYLDSYRPKKAGGDGDGSRVDYLEQLQDNQDNIQDDFGCGRTGVQPEGEIVSQRALEREGRGAATSFLPAQNTVINDHDDINWLQNLKVQHVGVR
ncbi:hypothetical protein CBR_g44303 [Chara braunii]|uniref:Uncharacterized protein n=1 Tax=Chara braunii TaxID=69332 RepID=A0A388K2Z8_CHABU|nr:hypothetical protein CBR_g44303 [Chara braunii]|eukprot:GBG64418.1 hypothetical protein CBR_g44303 [Chara braunii]